MSNMVELYVKIKNMLYYMENIMNLSTINQEKVLCPACSNEMEHEFKQDGIFEEICCDECHTALMAQRVSFVHAEMAVKKLKKCYECKHSEYCLIKDNGTEYCTGYEVKNEQSKMV